MVQDGFDVACFKAQNMSLNSYVTADGKEMGRAQVVQAEACRLEPDVRMNPVLLKPHQDDGSEIIVMGEPIGRMNARTYHTYRDTLQQTVHRAYDDLAAEHEVMVLEGAGSVGEINLKHTDIVNMPMAAHAGAHTFLVGDIDRGGVFASCIGILNTMEQWERRLIKGYLINKFRGDPSLLDTAYAYLERYTGVPVLGTVAFIDDMVIAGEDSVDMDMRSTAGGDMTRDRITIGMIVLPHISNYTDMDALRLEPDVRVEPVRRPEQIEGLDVVVIPGSKNVCADMRMLHARGFAAALRKAGHNPAQELVGICGGFQMLGHEIVEGDDADPAVLNDARNVPRIRGIGCIDMRSLYRSRKTRRRVHATFIEADQPVCGYEIHYGYTRAEGLLPVLRSADTDMDPGARSPDGSCWGCYLHGMFDADGFRRWFINRVRMRKGMPPLAIQTRYNQDAQLDMVAKRVRDAVQLDRIYAMLGIA
jgi:adenosylcobyric acid synthase